jgi:hypothetical protein
MPAVRCNTYDDDAAAAAAGRHFCGALAEVAQLLLCRRALAEVDAERGSELDMQPMLGAGSPV